MKINWFFTCILAFVFSLSAQSQNKDSTIYVVLHALTADGISVSQPIKDLLINASWEALAYWETTDPKNLDYLHEAVGDIYTFGNDLSFILRMIDKNNQNQFGLEIKGTYQLNEYDLILKAENGKYITSKIRYLDKLYLILEFDGLRIFYTKSKSDFSYD